jgi:L-lactate dehydrogenase complex protein LldF
VTEPAAHGRTPAPRRESRRHFRRRVEDALANPSLQRALPPAMVAVRGRRRRAFEDFDDASGREELGRRRRGNLARLPELVDQFRQRLEQAGGRFHVARDGEEACRIVAEICQGAGARVVAKSKSMATEEILLNPHLESLGIEVVETDVGEYIIQRLGQRPSHMLGPAIHLTVEDWAEELGVEADPEAIMAFVRRELRRKFLEADVGISGANAAIAETGTVMIVSNEGNVDLTVTLPRVHIAVFGMDKVVASLDDAVALLRMLPRTATGQVMSASVNFVTGPSRTADIAFRPVVGAHGSHEVHCVVLDNGRSRMLADPRFADAMTCIRCAACHDACPSFMAVGGQTFGHIYGGPIGLVLTPFHHGQDAAELPNSLCTQCGACEDACPVGIELPRMILEHRREGRKTLAKRALLGLWSRPRLARAALGLRGVAGRLVGDGGGGGPTVPVVPGPRPARAPTRSGPVGGPPVTLFASCLVERLAPGADGALIEILSAAGHRVTPARDRGCCGLVCGNAGDFEKGARLLDGLARSLAGSEGPIVTPSTSCFAAVTMDSAGWTDGASAPAHVSELRGRMRDATRFALELLEARPDLVRPVEEEGRRMRVAYHDSCQSMRRLGLVREPRRLLELAGYEVVDLPDTANCCGFGGTFSLDWPQVADRLVEWKLDAIAKTGCVVVASDNPGCLMHIGSGATRRGLELRVVHVLELVAERLVCRA